MIKEEFIIKANLKHDNKYNYDKVIYKDDDTYILIVCDIHGAYNRTPTNHLKHLFQMLIVYILFIFHVII